MSDKQQPNIGEKILEAIAHRYVDELNEILDLGDPRTQRFLSVRLDPKEGADLDSCGLIVNEHDQFGLVGILNSILPERSRIATVHDELGKCTGLTVIDYTKQASS